MAYIKQEQKKQISQAIKAVLKEYGMKGTIGIRDHKKLVVNLNAGQLDLLGALQKYNDERAKLHDKKSINVAYDHNIAYDYQWVCLRRKDYGIARADKPHFHGHG